MHDIKHNDTTQYIANCIGTILDAPAHISQHWQRERDIAVAVSLAATEGEKAAREYLVRLANAAKEGCYAAPREMMPL